MPSYLLSSIGDGRRVDPGSGRTQAIKPVWAGALSLATQTTIEDTFRQWVLGKDPVEARVSIYHKIRDIPYAVVPELIDAERYVDIIRLNRGSCSPKHFLLGNMFQKLGMLVLFVVYPFRWGERAELVESYPDQLRGMTQALPLGHHLACKVEIDGRLVLVDATLDPALGKAGLPVNPDWDGFSDTLLPMTPCGEEQVFHPTEAYRMQPHSDELSLAFYAALNACLEEVRRDAGQV